MAGKRTASVLDEVSAAPLERAVGTPVTVGGETVTVGPLSLNQWIALTRIGVGALSTLSPDARKQVEHADAWASLIALLDEDSIAQLYATLIRRDHRWVTDHFSLIEFLNVLDAQGQHENLREIVSAFKRVAKRW